MGNGLLSTQGCILPLAQRRIHHRNEGGRHIRRGHLGHQCATQIVQESKIFHVFFRHINILGDPLFGMIIGHVAYGDRDLDLIAQIMEIPW